MGPAPPVPLFHGSADDGIMRAGESGPIWFEKESTT